MKKAIFNKLRAEIEFALKNGYPNMDVNFALRMAKEDYLKTPAKERANFTVFDRGTIT